MAPELNLIKPGDWLEIKNYSPETADLLIQRQQAKLFIVDFQLANQQDIHHPYLLKVDNINDLNKRNEFSNTFRKGLLLSANDSFPFSDLPTKLENVWLDYTCLDLRKTFKNWQYIRNLNFARVFLSPHKNLSIRKFHRFLHQPDFQKNLAEFTIRPHDICDSEYNDLSDLEGFIDPVLEKNLMNNPQYSIIVPHFETPYFLTNLVRHFEMPYEEHRNFEILVIDDYSSEKSFSYLLAFVNRYINKIPIRLFRWPKKFLNKTNQRVFRAGASRNWGATFSKGQKLLFLDSDMLVPPNIIKLLDESQKRADVIQFARWHVPPEESSESANYEQLIKLKNLYIEEEKYWKPLFESIDWQGLPDHWKYTCTYGLSVSRELFFEAGRFRRNFTKYGFEDTDLGYRLMRMNKKFHLCQTPLLHLSKEIDHSQNWIYRLRKTEKLKPMARMFYSLNCDKSLYPKLQGLLE